jgi:DNA ligase-1
MMHLTDVVETSRAVAESSSRLRKIERLAALLKRTPPDDLELAIAYLSGVARPGRIGVSGAAIREARGETPAVAGTLHLREVDATFEAISQASGSGSTAARVRALRDLFRRATPDERDFLTRLLFGELRQGALEGVLTEAVARAAGIPSVRIRRAVMLEGSLGPVARAAIVEGASALDLMEIRPFRPVQPMLAASAENVRAALSDLGEAVVEYKLDGARIQVHKSGADIRVFSRALRDVTPAVPEVVESVRAVAAREAILDGEVIALRSDGTPQPFQVTMRRFGRTLDVEGLRTTLPISPFFFDCLYLDGSSLIDEPLSRRSRSLTDVAPADLLVPRIVTANVEEAAAFAERAVGAGHEGIMAKAVGAPYAAGRRGAAWLKVKQARTLDLVVLAVEWGSGRRRGTLSNLHLGARDAERGGYVMLGKTFKGLSDALLAWQTKRLLELETGRDGHTVHVRPQLVVEIAFNEIQESRQYPGRLALRFARVKRYRPEKSPDQADTLQTVQQIYRQTTGFEPPDR